MKQLAYAVVTAAVALPLSGCLIMTDNEKIVDADVPRAKVDFESEEGLVTFHNALRRNDNKGNRDLGESTLVVPFIIASNTEKTLGYNAYYNKQIEIADINQDGTLSDLEVRAYAGKLMDLDEPAKATASE